MKKALQAHPKQAERGEWPDEAFKKKYPALCEYMSDDKWEDGSPRKVSSVSLKFQDGLVLATLNDQDGNRGLYRAAPSVHEALTALDKAAIDPGADWRAWNGNTKKKRS